MLLSYPVSPERVEHVGRDNIALILGVRRKSSLKSLRPIVPRLMCRIRRAILSHTPLPRGSMPDFCRFRYYPATHQHRHHHSPRVHCPSQQVYIDAIQTLHLSACDELELGEHTKRDIEGLLSDLRSMLEGVGMLRELTARCEEGRALV